MKGRQPADCAAIGGQPATPVVSDAELLERFVSRRDESAFAALMARHGPMVFGVCRRSLHHAQDAEDAFQATFLILVRKAADIGKRELLGNWLYGVASRVSARARLVAARRQTREVTDMERVAAATREPTPSTNLSEPLEEEVRRLPAKYRGPVVLCYLEGRTNEEAAGELRCPIGTVKTRLARAREMMRKRLTRRGVVLSTAAIVTALSAETLAASLSPVLIDSTLKAAMCFAAGDTAASGLVSAQAIALTKGVLHTMFVTKVKTVAALVLALVVVGGGGGMLTYRLLGNESPTKKTDKKVDKENIQDTWIAVSAEADGQAAPAEAIKDVTVVITADKVVFNPKGENRVSTYKLDSTKTPKVIVLTPLDGPAKGESLRAIYELKGDRLKLCLQNGKGDPPTEFATKPGTHLRLLVLKRAPKR
jgi:RNA polymerase sigma factor (sigma-70 family)